MPGLSLFGAIPALAVALQIGPAEPAPSPREAPAPAAAPQQTVGSETPAPSPAAPAGPPVVSTAAPEPAPQPVAAPAPQAPRKRHKRGPIPAPEEKGHRIYPRLVLAAAPIVGPHTIGTEECRAEELQCQFGGRFLGLGGTVELRPRLYKALYAHVRFLGVGNVLQEKPVYKGLVGAGVGIGAYGRHIFARIEYLPVFALGDGSFEPPFSSRANAQDDWGNHAGMWSVGARFPFTPRLSGELWGGMTIGPGSKREIEGQPVDERMLVSFMFGVGVAWGAIL